MTDGLDQWADVRSRRDDEAPVTAAELARLIFDQQSGKRQPNADFEVLPLETRENLRRQAQRILDTLSGRRLTDPEKLAVARLHSAADRIAEDCSSAVEEALREAGMRTDDVRRDGWRDGVLYVVRELDVHGLADTVAGVTRLDDALRAFEREAR